jgi:hypothetical protein
VVLVSITFVVSLGLLALGLEIRLGSTPQPIGSSSSADLGAEYRQTFTGSPAERQVVERMGPDAEQCVQFEPEGLRITLPVGYAGPLGWHKERPDTGVTIPVMIKGNFDIALKYEILKEPNPNEAGFPHTRISLDMGVDRAAHVEATLSRRICQWGGPQFLTWVRRQEEGGDKSRYKEHAAEASSGWLRMIRNGSMIAYYAAEGPEGSFTLLEQYPFSPDPIEDVRIVASTGGPQAALDVRVTDLHIRAESLRISSDTALGPAGGKGWSAIALAAVLLLVAVLAAGGAARRLHLSRKPPAPAEAARSNEAAPDLPRFSFPCSHCGKKLKAGTALSGKQVKCPACGKSVHVTAGPV